MKTTVRGMFCVAVMLTFMPQTLCADTNPSRGYAAVQYRTSADGQTLTADRWFNDAMYLVDDDGWCTENHKTAADQKYDHVHMTNGIPFNDSNYIPAVSVTAQKINWAYDASHPGWTASGAPTCEYNCHCFSMMATPAGPYICCTAKGTDIYRADAGYQSITQPTASCISWTRKHSFKILDIYTLADGCKAVKTVKEKDGPSAIYEITWPSPGHNVDNLYAK